MAVHSSTTFTNDDPNVTGHKIYGSIVAIGFKITSMWVDPTAPKCFTFVMGSEGSPPSGTFTAKIYNSGGVSQETSTSSYDQTTVPGSGAKTEYTFAFTGDQTLSNNMYVCIVATGTDNSNALYVHQYHNGSARNATDGLQFVYLDSAGNGYPDNTWNPDVSLTSVSCVPEPHAGTRFPPPPIILSGL